MCGILCVCVGGGSFTLTDCCCFPTDQFDKVKKFYQESQQAEEKCNASVSGPESPLQQSNQTRQVTEELLSSTKDQLLQNATAHNRSLNELQQKAQNLSEELQHLSQKVRSSSKLLLGT